MFVESVVDFSYKLFLEQSVKPNVGGVHVCNFRYE